MATDADKRSTSLAADDQKTSGETEDKTKKKDQRRTPSAKMSSVKIMVVDDEEAIRRQLHMRFTRMGCEVLSIESVDEAVRVLAKENIDIVISDVRMPGKNGIDLLKFVKSEYPEIPFFLMTGYGDVELHEVYAHGAEAVFPKPFDTNILIHNVSKAAEEKEQVLLRRPRVDVIEVQVSCGPSNEKILRAEMENLGIGGMFIATDYPFCIGDILDCSFSVRREHFLERFSGRCEVRWIRPEKGDSAAGVGTKFLDLDEGMNRALVEIVNKLKTSG